jgi:hypothetical protein
MVGGQSVSGKRKPRFADPVDADDHPVAKHGPTPGFVQLVLFNPPWPAIGLAILALLLSQAPDPTNPDATGVSLKVFALPFLALSIAAAVPTALRAVSQKRALAKGEWITARVTNVEVLRSEAVLPRNRILWADPLGRACRSLIIKKRWVPRKGSKIRVLEDPGTGKQWWEGDVPGTLPQDAPASASTEGRSKGASLSAAWSWISTWTAIFGGLIALLLGLSDAPLLLTALPVIALVLGSRSAMLHLRALDRALRFGQSTQAKVTAHRAPTMGRVSSRKNSKGAAMIWETRQGHFGETDFIAAQRVIPVGGSLTVHIDPLSGEAFWKDI